MSLTKKTPQEFEYKTLEWGTFKFPDLRILFKGHVLPPSMIPHTFPLRRSAFTHLPDSHVFGDGQDGQADASTDAPAGPIDKIKRKVANAHKHSMSVTVRCALYRFPVFLWSKGGSKICCFDLEIIIPGKLPQNVPLT